MVCVGIVVAVGNVVVLAKQEGPGIFGASGRLVLRA
jgi:hypothetical protein